METEADPAAVEASPARLIPAVVDDLFVWFEVVPPKLDTWPNESTTMSPEVDVTVRLAVVADPVVTTRPFTVPAAPVKLCDIPPIAAEPEAVTETVCAPVAGFAK